MDIVCESAEHHFLTTLEGLKDSSDRWISFYFSLSKNISHQNLMSQPFDIQKDLELMRDKSTAFIARLEKETKNIEKGFIYLFSDHDVVLFAKPKDEGEEESLQYLYKDMLEGLGRGYADSGDLTGEFQNYQKLADQKFLSAKLFESYWSMGDQNKMSSISVRRGRRDYPRVLIVEDDRFTATYTANILNKEYDIDICENGEEAIKAYIERAPDIVLLDIHLPGIDGHQTLQAIKAIDPEAFVVMLSVDTARDSIMMASEIGAENFLKKPYSKERLLNTIKNSPFVKNLYKTSTDYIGESLH